MDSSLIGRQGAWALQARQGGIHGNPASGNPILTQTHEL